MPQLSNTRYIVLMAIAIVLLKAKVPNHRILTLIQNA